LRWLSEHEQTILLTWRTAELVRDSSVALQGKDTIRPMRGSGLCLKQVALWARRGCKFTYNPCMPDGHSPKRQFARSPQVSRSELAPSPIYVTAAWAVSRVERRPE